MVVESNGFELLLGGDLECLDSKRPTTRRGARMLNNLGMEKAFEDAECLGSTSAQWNPRREDAEH